MALKDGLYKKKEEDGQQDQTKDTDYWKEKALAGGGRSASSGNARGEDYWKNKALSGGTWTPTKKKDQLLQNIYSYNQQRQSDPLYRAMYDQYASYLETMRLASPAVQAEEMTSSKLYNKLPERMQNAIASNVSDTLAKKGMAGDVKAHAEGLRAAGVNGFDYAKAMARYAGTGETGADTMTDEQRAAYDSASENYLAGVSDEQKAANAYMQSTAYAMAQQNRNADAIHSATNPDAPENSRAYWTYKSSHARRQANAAEQYLEDVIAPLEDERQAAMETVSPWEKQEELDAAYEEYYRLRAEDEKWNSVAEQAEEQLYLFDAIEYTDEAKNQPDFRQKVLEGYMAYCRDVGYEPQQERYALAEWAKGNLDELPKDVLFAGMEVIPYLHGDDYDKNAAFYYLYATDPNTAQDLLDRKQEAYADKLNSELYEWAGQNTFTRTVAAAGSILSTPLTAAEGIAKIFGADIKGNSMTKMSGSLQSGGAAGLEEKGLFNTGFLSGKIDESIPLVGGLSLGSAYSLGISMGQSFAGGMIFGSKFSIVLGLSAASSAYDEAIATGASEGEARETALARGIAEALFEYISLDKLVNPDAAKQWWKRALGQGGIEASEELCTSLANAFTDQIIRGKNSDLGREIQRLVTEEGLTYEQARANVTMQFVTGLFQDALGGFASGGAMSVGRDSLNAAFSIHQWNNDRRSAETQFYGNMAKDGTTDAMSAFLTDNGKHSKTDSTRAIKRTEAAAVKTMSEQFSAAATVAEAQEIYDGVTERYGKSIKKTASRAWAASVSERFGNAKTTEELETVYNELTGGKKVTRNSTEIEKIAAAAYTARAAKLAAKQKGATEESVREAALKPYTASKVTTDTEAAFIREDGTEAHAAVVSMNEKGDLVLDNGTTVSAKDAVVSTKTQAALNAVQVIGGKTGALFFEQYLNYAANNPSVDGADYIAALHDAYLQGMSAGAEGRQASFAKRTSNLLTEAAYDYAYNLGVDQADTETREQAEKINRQIKEAGKGATGRVGSVTFAKNVDTTTKNAKRALTTGKIIAQAAGVDVRLVKGSGQMEGSYHNGVLTLDIDQLQRRPGETVQGAIMRVASHELTHFIQDKNAADYKALKNFCFGHILQAHTQEEINRQRDAIIESNKNAGKELSPEAAIDEMVANACEQMLLNSDILSELYKQNASLAQKVQIKVSEFFAKLRQNIGNGARSKEVAWMSDAMDELQEKWEAALRVAAENQIKLNSAEGTKNTATEGGVKEQFALVGYTKDGRRVYETDFDPAVSEKDRIDIFEERIATIFNLGAVVLKTDTKKIKVLGDKFTSEKNLYGDFVVDMNGNVHPDAEERSAKINALYDMADILQGAKFVPPAIPEDSYITNNPPKNKAHKNVKYWYKFTTNIVMDGKGYKVTFNIRDKGKGGQYQYLIEFKKDGTSGNGNTAVSGLLRTNPDVPRNNDTTKIRLRQEQNSAKLSADAMDEVRDTVDDIVPVQEQFSVAMPVEQTDELIAVHNLTEQNLIDTLNLGGFPSPSIAIIKAANGHTKYGPISVVFKKSAIDPQADSRNKVYGADAWTPTAPSVSYKISETAADTIRERIEKAIGDQKTSTLFRVSSIFDPDNIRDKVERSDGKFAEAYSRESATRYAFLRETGRAFDLPVKTAEYHHGLTVYDMKELGKLIHVTDAIDANYEETMRIEPKIRKYLYDKTLERYKDKGAETAKKLADALYTDQMPFNKVNSILYDFVKFSRNGAQQEIDRQKFDTLIDEAFSSDEVNREYMQWLEDLGKDIVEKKGIRNDTDLYTRAGNRRSWEQLHDEYTLENIVRAMNRRYATGDNAWGATSGTVQSVTTKKFKSISDIRSDSSRLTKLQADEYEKIKEDLGHRISEVTNEIFNTTEHHDDNRFMEYDIISEVLLNAGRAGSGVQSIIRSFRKDGYTISEALAEKISGIFKDAASIPTEYFEAKPQRAVHFDEVAAVIMPDGTNADVVRALTDRGVNVQFYERDNDAERTEVLNSLKDNMFSVQLGEDALDIGEAEQLTDEDLLWNMRMEDAPEYAQETLHEYKQLASEKNRLQRKLNAIEADAEKKTGISAMSKRQLQAKIRQLENQVKQAREQTKRTAAKREARLKNIDASSIIHSIADTIANERTLSRYAKAELRQLYSDVLALVDNGQVAAAQELLQKGATQLAGRILEHMMVEDDAVVQAYDDVREFMKHQSIRVSPEIMRDIAGPRQEDWNGYRAANGQRIVVTNGDTNIEDLYQQLSEIAPTLFDDQTYNLSDMADRIVSVLSDAYDRSSKTVPVTDAYGYSNAQYNYDMGKLYEAIIEDFKDRATPIAQTVADRIETEMQQKYGIRIGELQAELEQEREQKQKAEKTAAAARNANGDLIMRNSMLDNKLTSKNAEAAAWGKYWADVNKTLSRYQSRTQHLEAENAALSEKNAQMRQDMRTLREMDVAAEKATESKHKAEVAKLQRQIAGLENRMNDMLTKNELRTVVADERAKAAAEMKNRKDQQMKDYRERKKRTEIMHKIEAVKDMLNKRLMHPTTEKHIPPELSRAVVDFLETVNADAIKVPQAVRSKADGMWKIRIKLGGDIYTVESSTERGCIEKARTLKLEYQNRTGEAGTKRASLDRIAKLYEDVKNDTEYYSAVYDENVRDMISEVKETVGGRALYELGTAELQDVYTAIRALTTVISNANKAFIENRNMTISEMAMASINFMQSRKGKQYRAAFMDNIKGTAKKAFWNNLKPVYAFRMLGDKTLQGLFDNVRRGEDVWAVDIDEAKAFFDDAAKKYGYEKWDFKKSYKFEDKTGKTFSLTLQQMLSLYAYSRREQAADHLAKGGIVFEKNSEIVVEKGTKKKTVKFNTDDAYPLPVDVLAEIAGTLTDEQKKFAVTMQDYLSDVMGGKGNEVTMQLYGIRRFGEKYYFPLKSSDKYIFDYEQKQNVADPRIKNSGFTKDTVKNASNPIVVQDFMDVWAEHVNRMSQYHALVLPLEDFNRVYGWKHAFVIDEENGVTVNESVRASIGNAWGDAPIGYINQLLKDLNGSVVTDNAEGLVNKGLSLFKKGSVFASLSVVIQQPSAVARAMAYIPEKYFVGKAAEKLSGHKANWEQCKKYAPVAIIKEMGYFDVGMGQSTVDYLKTVKPEGFKEKLGAVFTDSAYRDELLSWAPAMADEVTWTKIWKAAKRMAADTTNLKGEALLQKAGEIFTEAIVNTQVYDSVLSRSALMRSKDTGMKMATAFMAEPTTSANMLIDAVVQGKRGNKKFGALAVKSVAASIILNSILSAFVYAGRDDDDDETYLEKYLEALVSQLIDGFNPVNMVPFLRDIWSIAEGYDVERSDLSWADDLYRAISNLWSDKLSLTDKLLGISGAIGNITGLPIKNIYRDAKGLAQTIQKFFNGEPQTGAGVKYALIEGVPEIFGGGKVSNAKQLADAAISGDSDQFERVAGRYSSRDEAEERLSSELKARYYAETLPREDAMKLLVQYGGQTEDEAYWTVDKWDEAQKHKGEDDWNYSKYHTLREAIYSGSGVDAAVRELTSHGTNKDDVREQVKTIVTEAYEAGKITESKARSLLQKYWKDDADGIDDAIINSKCYSATGVRYDDLKTAYLDGDMSVTAVKSALQKYGGMTEAEATSRIRYWDFKADHPNSNVKQETIDKYYDKVPDGYGMTLHQAGIPLDVYVDYHERQSKCTGTDADGDGKTDSGSKKAAILQVIDSLPISAAQKDALYYFNGWAASKIYEAP